MGELQGGIRRSQGRSPEDERSEYIHYTVLYSITVKRLSIKFPPVEYYDDFIWNNINKKGELKTYNYELDSKGKLHLHGVFECAHDFDPINLCRKGWKVHCDEIPSYDDLSRWIDYINKDHANEYEEEQMLDTYAIRHCDYPFI